VIGEGGRSLSGGQRQRMAIARSLLPAPGSLIFDDPAAAVDVRTEARIKQAMTRGAENRLTLIAAHLLCSMLHADRIPVLKDGRLVEQGSHAELLALGGPYAGLYRANHASFDDAEQAAGPV
jgi:ATP-binding cassette subfamily B protein